MKFSSMLPFKHLLAVLNKIFSVSTSFEKLRWRHAYITHVGRERFQNLKIKKIKQVNLICKKNKFVPEDHSL